MKKQIFREGEGEERGGKETVIEKIVIAYVTNHVGRHRSPRELRLLAHSPALGHRGILQNLNV